MKLKNELDRIIPQSSVHKRSSHALFLGRSCGFSCTLGLNQWIGFENTVYGTLGFGTAVDEREAVEAPERLAQRAIRRCVRDFARECDVRAEGFEIGSESRRCGRVLERCSEYGSHRLFFGRHCTENLLTRPMGESLELQLERFLLEAVRRDPPSKLPDLRDTSLQNAAEESERDVEIGGPHGPTARAPDGLCGGVRERLATLLSRPERKE
jgi:hypothetical protein